jgi:hypothetical protein
LNRLNGSVTILTLEQGVTIMRFNVSVLHFPTKFDVVVSANLPRESYSAIAIIVRDVATAYETPRSAAALLARKMMGLADSYGRAPSVTISNEMDYDGRAITINLAEKRVTLDDSGTTLAATLQAMAAERDFEVEVL